MKVLVVNLRGLQLGYVGCYGNRWVETPTLDRLAAEGVVFDQHFADQPDAAGACRAWRSGRYLLPPADVAPPPAPDLPALLHAHGIPTTLVLDGSRPLPEDFRAGWQSVRVVPAEAEEGTSLERTLEACLEAVEELAEADRWLVWICLGTLLPPWDPPDDYLDAYLHEEASDEDEEDEAEEREPLSPLLDPEPGEIDREDDETFLRLQRSYAAAVTHLDAGLGLLFEELRKAGLLDELLLLVTADHGLPLGEHGIVGGCRPWLHAELVHLPLLVRLPGAAEAGRRVAALTQSVDLPPTLLDAFGLPAADVHGHSLLPLLRGQAEEVREYACSALEAGGAVEWALRTPEWCFLLPVRQGEGEPARAPQLYVKPDDRCEMNDVRQHHLELAERLEGVLRGFADAARRPGPLQPPELPCEEERDEEEGPTGDVP
jgi:arylsulfatase A-like enzyme